MEGGGGKSDGESCRTLVLRGLEPYLNLVVHSNTLWAHLVVGFSPRGQRGLPGGKLVGFLLSERKPDLSDRL